MIATVLNVNPIRIPPPMRIDKLSALADITAPAKAINGGIETSTAAPYDETVITPPPQDEILYPKS